MSAVPFIYVIMPVGSDPLVENKKCAVRDAIKEIDRTARFPLYSLDDPSFSIENLIAELHEADAVLADLSYERPSCYYELGVAEAIGKQVYLIAEAGTPIHQCDTRNAVCFYLDAADVQKTVRSALRGETDSN